MAHNEYSLKHVSMWTDRGFEPTTPENASAMFPRGASCNSGLFICRLCGQNVTLAKNSYSTYFFKHSRGEHDKNCPDRTFSIAGSWLSQLKKYSLPIRLSLNSYGGFSLSIGIVVPQAISVSDGILQIEANGNTPYQFQLNNLADDNITYFSIGQDIAPEYKLTVQNTTCSELEEMIPPIIEGISGGGCLFHKYSNSNCGKKVPQGANVQTNTDYYLLTFKPIVLSSIKKASVECERITECSIRHFTWYVYRVRATHFDRTAAEFFMQFRCILTEATVSLTPVWPVYRNSPYITYHQGFKMWFYLDGQDVSAETYPLKPIYREIINDTGQALCITCGTRQQTLLAGKSRILRYTYLWIDPLHTETELPKISVMDISENIIEAGVSNSLPPKGILCIKAHFDGRVNIRKSGRIIEKRPLKADETVEIDQIRFGISIDVLQGLDIVWHIEYLSVKPTASANDDLLHQQLCSCSGRIIPFPHRYGAALNRLTKMPKCKQWFIACMRQGQISEDAFDLFKRIINEMRCRCD